jgi:predicted dehydrogenase
VGSSGFIGQSHLQHVLQEKDSGKLNETSQENRPLYLFGRTRRTHVRSGRSDFSRELTLVSDTAPSVATTARQHDVPHFKNVGEFLKAYKSGDLAVDAIILATPTQTHVTLAQSLAENGLSLLIEKPLSATGRDGKSLLALSKQDARSVYMVGHHRRHNAYVKAVKHVLDKKKLGDIVAVNGGESNHSDHYAVVLIAVIVWAMRKHDAYYDILWHTQIGVGGVVYKSWHSEVLLRC